MLNRNSNGTLKNENLADSSPLKITLKELWTIKQYKFTYTCVEMAPDVSAETIYGL